MNKASDVVVSTLATAGVQKVFGLVGTSTLDIVDAVTRHPDMEFVSARTEESAAHMADGYARASGRLGVVLCHVGPGALRQLYGVGTAWKDSVPLLLLTGNEVLQHTDLHMREAYHVVDVHEAYRAVTKATLQLRDADDAGAAVARGVWLATSGRPGPVLLDLPKTAIKATADTFRPVTPRLSDRVPATRTAPDPEQVQVVAKALRDSVRPVIVAGGGVHWSNAADEVTRLAESRNLPVVTTDGGRGAMPEDHDSFVGVLARQAGDQSARDLLSGADVVLALGTPFSDVSTFEWSAWGDDVPVFQIDITSEVGLKGVSTSQTIVADVRQFLAALDDELAADDFRHAQNWAASHQAFVEGRRAYLDRAGQACRGGVNPWRIISALDKALPRDAFISIDSGMHSFFGKKLRVFEPRTYLRSAGFGAMGYSFPAVMGALEFDPNRRGVAVVGDGCLSMCMAEFETAARRRSPVTVVVFNDSSFASQLNHQRRRLESRFVGTRFLPTDFSKVAEAQGVPGRTVTRSEDMADAVEQALATQGPFVIDARVDPEILPPAWIEGSGDPRIAGS